MEVTRGMELFGQGYISIKLGQEIDKCEFTFRAIDRESFLECMNKISNELFKENK